MNEVTLAEMADRLVKLHEEEGIRTFVTNDKRVTAIDADLLTAEMARRGVDMTVLTATTITIR